MEVHLLMAFSLFEIINVNCLVGLEYFTAPKHKRLKLPSWFELLMTNFLILTLVVVLLLLLNRFSRVRLCVIP